MVNQILVVHAVTKNNFKKPIEQRVELFRQYYKRENTRPLLGFFKGSEYPLYRYEASKSLPEKRPLSPDDIVVEPYLDDCEQLFVEHEACGGDFIWSAAAFWGIPWLEATLGCEIFADHSTGSIYSEKPTDFSGPDSIPAFDTDNPWIQKTIAFLDKMAEKSQGRWPLATTRMRGVSDLLSALYGGTEVVFAMMEKPDEIQVVCKKLTDFWIEYGKLQLQYIPLFHGGIGSFYYYLWAPEGTVWHQEDATALLSPGLFQEFIGPCDRKITEAFSSCIMHQHSTGYVPVDSYLAMNFTALELHIDEGGPSAEELYETHLKILDKKPLIIWGDTPEKDLDWIFQKLPVQGLAVITVVSSPEEAKAIWEKYIL